MISTASKTFFFFFSLEGPVRRESNALSSEWKFREKQLTTVTAANRHLLDNLQRGGVVVDHQNPETHRKLRRSRTGSHETTSFWRKFRVGEAQHNVGECAWTKNRNKNRTLEEKE